MAAWVPDMDLVHDAMYLRYQAYLQARVCQAANVRTARGSFEVRTANPKRFEPLASRYVSNSRYLLFKNTDNYYCQFRVQSA